MTPIHTSLNPTSLPAISIGSATSQRKHVASRLDLRRVARVIAARLAAAARWVFGAAPTPSESAMASLTSTERPHF